jgi:SAM-dependent methyltransferase
MSDPPVDPQAGTDRLGALEAAIYNDGERLIPGVTHDRAELVRHRSSYVFWRAVIELDCRRLRHRPEQISVVDLGCGVGHGCATLADLPGVRVVGVDSSKESLEYARRHYARRNVEYLRADLVDFIPGMPAFDYAVSRASMEHVPDGLELIRRADWRYRLLFDVPYDETPGVNPHHVVHNVTEASFEHFDNAEIFFQDLGGVTYDRGHKPERPNVIVCVSSRPDLKPVQRLLRFPIRPWSEYDPGPRPRGAIPALRRSAGGARPPRATS